MKEATSIKALISSLWWCVCVTCVCVHSDEWCNGVGVHHVFCGWVEHLDPLSVLMKMGTIVTPL